MAGIGDIAKATGLKTAQVKAVFDELVRSAASGETVSLQGLGNFRVVDRKATTARNPQTGEQLEVAASKRLRFSASKTLRDRLNPGHEGGKPIAASPQAASSEASAS